MKRPNHDPYGEVINGVETYEWIIWSLKEKGTAFIGWTDEASTHLDILFAFQVPSAGSNIQGGIQPARDLLVSIMRGGSFGFNLQKEWTHEAYFSEKLHTSGATSLKIAELINEVRSRMSV